MSPMTNRFIASLSDLDEIHEKEKPKTTIGMRIGQMWRNMKILIYNIKYTFRNHVKWHKTMRHIRPCEGFGGLISVMQAHLKDYSETEEKCGIATGEQKKQILDSLKETISLLEGMRDPHGHLSKRLKEAKAKYPEPKYLMTEYADGSMDMDGVFIAQGNGYAGILDDDNAGYFEFADGKFGLAESPDQCETDRLIAELDKYDEERDNARKQSEKDTNGDFEKLHLLLKENLYSWWAN